MNTTMQELNEALKASIDKAVRETMKKTGEEKLHIEAVVEHNIVKYCTKADPQIDHSPYVDYYYRQLERYAGR